MMAEITFPPGHGIPLVRLSDYLFVPAVQDAQDEHLAARLKTDIDSAKKAASDAQKAKQGLEEAEANAKDYASHAKQAKEDAEEARDDINSLNLTATAVTLAPGEPATAEVTGVLPDLTINLGLPLTHGGVVDPEAIATAVDDYLAANPPTAGTYLVPDPAHPGLYLPTAGSSMIPDPAHDGLYTIGPLA